VCICLVAWFVDFVFRLIIKVIYISRMKGFFFLFSFVYVLGLICFIIGSLSEGCVVLIVFVVWLVV
jgi:hypothetical protein